MNLRLRLGEDRHRFGDRVHRVFGGGRHDRIRAITDWHSATPKKGIIQADNQFDEKGLYNITSESQFSRDIPRVYSVFKEL
jgi:hypothetical protein